MPSSPRTLRAVLRSSGSVLKSKIFHVNGGQPPLWMANILSSPSRAQDLSSDLPHRATSKERNLHLYILRAEQTPNGFKVTSTKILQTKCHSLEMILWTQAFKMGCDSTHFER